MREPQKWSSLAPKLTQEASFWVIFSRICGSGAIELLQKRPAKKIVTSHRQTDRFRADREAGGTPFRPPKTQIPPAKALKTGSATKSEILLTSRLKSTSGTSLVCTRSKLRLRRKNLHWHKKYIYTLSFTFIFCQNAEKMCATCWQNMKVKLKLEMLFCIEKPKKPMYDISQ